MTQLQELKITGAFPSQATQFKSGEQHPRWTGSCVPQHLMEQSFGSIRIVSPNIRRKNGYRYVEAYCSESGITKLTSLDNLLSGKSSSFFSNGVKPLGNKPLLRRCDAAQQRCNNPNNRDYHNYGGRGVQFNFPTVLAMAEYVLEVLGPVTGEIDRVDNDGHYEPGNLRYATRSEQIANRRNSMPQFKSPFSKNYTFVLLKRGLSPEQICALRPSTTL